MSNGILCLFLSLSVSLHHVIFDRKKKKNSTRMGFEPTRAEPKGLAVLRLNHSATSPSCKHRIRKYLNMIYWNKEFLKTDVHERCSQCDQSWRFFALWATF